MKGTSPKNVPGGNQSGQDQPQGDQQPKVVERLNPDVQQQLNFELFQIKADGLNTTISQIVGDFDKIFQSNSKPTWQLLRDQLSDMRYELFNIVKDLQEESSARAPEMETEDNSKREQLLHGMGFFPVLTHIEKLKERVIVVAFVYGTATKVNS